MEYSKLSKELTKNLPKTDKKEGGIYFTPPSCVEENLTLLSSYLEESATILEPSCGSCEYVKAIRDKYPDMLITAIENNKQIYDAILPMGGENLEIIYGDYLKYESKKKYDVIIGNPPYFVLKKEKVDKEYFKYFEGRPNIFVLFIAKSLTLLNEKGVLSFILPSCFLNCVYYNKMRKHIFAQFQILHISFCDRHRYLETQQDTIMFIIQKPKMGEKPNNDEYSYLKNVGTGGGEAADILVFSSPEKIRIFHQLSFQSKTLYDMGFKVSVGNVVWNQHKSILTDDPTKTRLIYSSDIENGVLVLKKYSNEEKKNYIAKKGRKGALLVINRGYGVGGYSFNYCLINTEHEYLVENHLICVEPLRTMSGDELIDAYKKIMASFEDTRTREFITHYFGNDAINTTEMNYILPIY